MKRIWMLAILSIFVLLMACGQQQLPTPSQSVPEELALISEFDVENALEESFDLTEYVEAEEGESISDGIESNLADVEADLSSQAVLPGASGFIYYVQHNPNLKSPWRIYRYNQTTNQNSLIYASNKEIQSVAGSDNGLVIVFAMRETATGDMEIYRATLAPTKVSRLTRNAVHDLHVSMSANARRVVWQSERNGLKTIYYLTYEDSQKVLRALVVKRDQIEPSVSASGQYIAFIRPGSPNWVMLYSVGGGYRGVYSSARALEHPSPTDNGNLVAFLQHATTDTVKIKNLSTGAILNAVSSASIRHPHMKSDGRWLTYGLVNGGNWDMFSKNLATGAVRQGTATNSPINHDAMYWQGEPSSEGLPDLIITRASIALAQVCAPYNPVLYVTATVKNVGTAPSPERLDVGLVNALDNHGNSWGNGIGLSAINPGDSTTVTFPIYYLIADPAHIVGSHQFDLKVNRGNWIYELDASNNGYAPLNIDIPSTFCNAVDPEHGRSWGDPHQISFDGLAYEFQAVGAFQFIETPSHDLNVQVCEKPWGNSNRLSVNKAVATMLAGWRVVFYADENYTLRINGSDSSFSSGAINVGGHVITRSGAAYTIDYNSGDQMVVTIYNGHIGVDFYAPAGRFGAISGLLGNANGTTSDDIALRDGTVLSQPVSFNQMYQDYANSWRLSAAESLFQADGYSCPDDLNYPSQSSAANDLDTNTHNEAEAICQNAGVSAANMEACIIDVGNTGETSFADSAAQSPDPQDNLNLLNTRISSYSLSPTSPATLYFGEQVNVNFHYFSNEASEVRIFVRPMTGGSLTAGYAAHGSPLYNTPEGDGTGYFTIQQGSTSPTHVDQLRFRVTNSDQSVILLDYFVDVDYTFIAPSANDRCEGSAPDFSKLSVSYTSSNIQIDLEFCSNASRNAAGDFIYLYGTNNHVVNFSASSFELRLDSDKNGHFETFVTSGSVSLVGTTGLRIITPRSNMTDIQTKDVWAYSMTSLDRLPNSGAIRVR